MTSLKILKKRVGLLAKQLEVDKVILAAGLELLDKGKIPKPEKVFKDTVPKLNRKAKYDFLIMDMGQKKYLLMGDVFPMGNDLTKKLEETRKKLSKASNPMEKEFLEQMEFFYDKMDKLAPKGFASGTIKFAREYQNEETGVLEHLMAVKTSGLKVGGSVKKSNLVEMVREELGYSLTSKLGEVMFLQLGETQEESMPKNDEPESSTTVENSTNSLDPIIVKKQVQQLLGQFKGLEPNKAFKGLGLIHTMTALIDKLENAPENLQVLAKKLEAQQERIVPVFSKQIDHKLGQSMTELEEIPVVESSSVLDNVFGTVKKMYSGWVKFLPGRIHPKGPVIEKVSDEIDILREYEKQILPLRKQFDAMEDSEEREQLGEQINNLINEAREALV